MKEAMESHKETLKDDVKGCFGGTLVNRQSFI
jgi:hypothetical protein